MREKPKTIFVQEREQKAITLLVGQVGIVLGGLSPLFPRLLIGPQGATSCHILTNNWGAPH